MQDDYSDKAVMCQFMIILPLFCFDSLKAMIGEVFSARLSLYLGWLKTNVNIQTDGKRSHPLSNSHQRVLMH